MQVVFLVIFDVSLGAELDRMSILHQNQEDCDYYTFEDPAHEEYKKNLRTWGLAGATVLDFAPGKF